MPASPQHERFEREVLPHLDAAHNLARWLLHDPHHAADATQEACLRALRYLPTWRGTNARAWLLAIVRNVCRTRVWQGREAPQPGGDPPEVVADSPEAFAAGMQPAPSPEDALARKRRAALLNACLAALPESLREVIVLRDLEGLKYREISEVVGVPLGTVMSRLSRGRQRLREAVRQRMLEPEGSLK